ncbi:adenylate/guanylate cyclase domain-containing protein [Oscillatoria salina]|uniref:adenylate/guanylate cyclase domain-containing protein n=1 Tax=Oscillatoria salina TaxID=331517 RepID=UPI0013BC02E0|nr:adenylate/guanylate cyclase domain-containing protein [Oscillatoria salina]MBZ8182699.1 response regulator [Oscillatoria salina IIICB1]NET87486.1 response regulator [Kamptonema sp. SIO1D9]
MNDVNSQQLARNNNQQNQGNILIVDDVPDNLRVLSHLLQSQGYKVRPVINGAMAIAAAKTIKPDLILLDINMPQMNGFQVCEKLKASETTADIPVIFLSALHEIADKIKAFEVGGADYITKPFNIQEVLVRIQNQLAQQQLRQQLNEQNLRLQAEIKERQKTEEEIRLLLSTTQAINESIDFQSALQVTLTQVCETIGWDFGEAWIPNQDNTVLEYSQGGYAKNPNLEEFRRKSQRFTYAPDMGLPGRIWSSQQFEWREDVSVESRRNFTRSQLAAEVGLKACFGVPLLVNNQVLAVLVFLKSESYLLDSRLVELVFALATQLGSLIQRKQALEALRLAEQRYHSIVENAIDGIFQTTPQGRYLSANPALAKIYGYDSPEEMIATLKNLHHQLYVDPNRRQEFIAAMAKDNAVSAFESMVYRKDGSKIWISENARAVRDSTGKLLYYEGTVSDITKRKLAEQELQLQQQKTEELLLNILPQPIAERLRNEQNTIADSFEAVTVLFADLVGFTEFSASTSSTELVEILNVIFSEFDGLAKEYGLEKIKTLGDAYMAVAGLPTPIGSRAAAVAAAEMALAMLKAIIQFNLETGYNFDLRIGLNSGSVIAGVIGVSKFAYDLWGDTVNVASRMESSGVAGKIQVTAATYELLQDRYLFEERGAIAVKGKGQMTTFWLTGKVD